VKLTAKGRSLDELLIHYGGVGHLKIDLGCGFYKPAGFIGLDNMVGATSQISSKNLPDIDIDLHHESLPFPDKSCVLVRTSHFLEHSNLELTFKEVARVLTDDGEFENIFPYALSDEGLYPGHSIFLTEKWFRENLLFNELFEILKFEYIKSDAYKAWPTWAKAIIPFNWARIHLFNVSNEIRMTARKKIKI
jgi:hypothetical protein